MSRTKERRKVFELLFQKLLNPQFEIDETLEENSEYIVKIFHGVLNKWNEIK